MIISYSNPPINFRAVLLATLGRVVQITGQISRNNPRLRRYLSSDCLRRKKSKASGKRQFEGFNFSSLLFT